MTDTPIQVLVLTDQDGAYYLLSRELLDQVRVPAEDAGELQRLIAAADTSGFAAFGIVPTLTPVASFAAERKSAILTLRKAGGEQHE